jgi:hypothetical protein
MALSACRLATETGTFQNAPFFSTDFTGMPPLFTTGDFNSHGNTDLLSYNPSGFLGGFLAGKGDGTFSELRASLCPGR